MFFFKWHKRLPGIWLQRHKNSVRKNSGRVGRMTIAFCSIRYLFYAQRDTQESINGQRPAKRTGRREIPFFQIVFDSSFANIIFTLVVVGSNP
jgi:hypothetical protein